MGGGESGLVSIIHPCADCKHNQWYFTEYQGGREKGVMELLVIFNSMAMKVSVWEHGNPSSVQWLENDGGCRMKCTHSIQPCKGHQHTGHCGSKRQSVSLFRNLHSLHKTDVSVASHMPFPLPGLGSLGMR